MIEIKNVSKHYETKERFTALNDVSFKVEKNDSFGIVGHSGAGKSTLIRLINGLIKPTTGEILIDGISINDLSKKEINHLRHNIGMVFQHFNLFDSLTVYENIKLNLTIANYPKNDIDFRVNEVINLVGLDLKKDLYPKSLSGGEKQRVGIARAIAAKPKYLLCDEITSALDNQTAIEIIDVLNKIKNESDLTIIFISHDLNMIRRFCNKVLVLDKGNLIELNDTLSIFINPQTKPTQNLIKTIIDFDSYYGKDIYKLTYQNQAKDETIISDMVIKYNIKLSIQAGLTLDILNESIGFLVIKITGENTKKAISYLKENGIIIKKLEKEVTL